MRIQSLLIAIAVATSVASAAPALAEATADFTFKRIKPPEKGARRLINIQVEPPAPVERVLANIPDIEPEILPQRPRGLAPAAPIGNSAPWFWSELSPALAAAEPDRMSYAVQVVSRNGASGPRGDHMSRLAERYGALVLKATAGTPVSPALVLAVISVESAGVPAARSHAGAVGLMQLMPATAARFGVKDRTDPEQNISGGVKYLTFLLQEFGADPLLALAAYNAGEGAVQRNGGVPNYSETREYVPKVVAAWTQARMLCLTPPERVTDACLFSGLRIAAQ